MVGIPVVFKSDQFIVVNKPAGLNFHSEDSAGLAVLLKQALGVDDLYPVHRLDKMTSGLVLFAFTLDAVREFGRLFESAKIDKWYVAITQGKPKKKQGWIKGDMVPARRGSWKLTTGQKNPSITQFISQSHSAGRRVCLIKLHTGKTHQIRVAMKSLGSPICGDERYQQSELSSAYDRGYLHAYAMQFWFQDELFEFVLLPEAGALFTTPESLQCWDAWRQPWCLFK